VATTRAHTDPVRAWRETVVIPTYGVGRPDRNPMFLEKRVYQGSSGVVYPHPVIDRVFDEKADTPYAAVFLENRYLKVMVLPELGGRVQMALDKTNGFHFIYHNRVIKPALVGLCGPWISGGIEFNWPQHHRPSTFAPVDSWIEERPDGSCTLWCAETERMFRTRSLVGLTLYPDRALLAVDVQVYNRTREPQTFLWWANPAVHAHDDYQSIFPPDVHAVMDHGKRAVSTFPIATGTYYKVDYSPGTDISRYRNIPVPTSFMAYHSDYDFIGCYDHAAGAGMMHVANHHLVPGKKQWTWGHGDFGRAWDRQLTDEDGPYVELMCGAFTDNQPDFSWLMPGEEKRFRQVFLPYKAIGGATNASEEVVVNLAVERGIAHVGVYVTRERTVCVRVRRGSDVLHEQTLALGPETALVEQVDARGAVAGALALEVLSSEGRLLLSSAPAPGSHGSIPEPASPAPPPALVSSNEELYLQGLHLEQYRHATYAPEPYYEEALRRDPDDSRCNNALGLLLHRRGRFADAEAYFRRAIGRLTLRNPNPYDGEPFYNLGLSLRMQGRDAEAFDAFYKASWSDAWQGAALFELARLASRRQAFGEALDLAARALDRNGRDHRVHHLGVALLRRLDRRDDALAALTRALALDPLDAGLAVEHRLLTGDMPEGRVFRGDVHDATEVALDYAHAGLFDEAVTVLDEAPGADDPMVKYYQGWIELQRGSRARALEAFAAAERCTPDYCFPHQLECVPALTAAIEARPSDRRAPYYLGTFWYSRRQHDAAVACWERARALDPGFPTVHRNLGLAYMNRRRDPAAARSSFERAFALEPTDARVLFEWDQLCKMLGDPPGERLARLEGHLDLVEARDDVSIERIALLNVTGQHEAALRLLLARTFHPWEGGEGKVTAQYVASLLALARQALAGGQPANAVDLIERAQTYPANLGEGKLPGAQENAVVYHLGCAREALGDPDGAREAFEAATRGLLEPTSPLYYNDQPPGTIYYQGLAWQKLGRAERAAETFRRLVDYGLAHLDDTPIVDYFAVSLPNFLVFDDDLGRRNRVHCHHMMGLGYAGLGEDATAQEHFEAVLRLQPDHLEAHEMLRVRLNTPGGART
jgi:tetratricopeptide (TPR) repeat protein